MKRKIISAILAAALVFTMPISTMAVSKPDEWSAPVELEETNETQLESITITEAHSHLETKYEYGNTRYYVFYAYQVHNPNTDWAIDFVNLKTTIYGADGSVLKTTTDTLDWVGEGDTYWYGNYVSFDSDGVKPTRIECTTSADSWNCHKASPDNQIIRGGELSVTNVSKRGSGYDLRFTGQVTNNSQFTSNSVEVIVLYKMKDDDGNEFPVGGEYTYISDSLAPGETTSFELHPTTGFTGYSSYEVIALQD